jgi:hypothetical protein
VIVTPAPDEIPDMAPIRDIRREEKLWSDYWPLLAILLAVIAIALAGYFIVDAKQGMGSQDINGLPMNWHSETGHLQQQGL